MGFLFGLGLIGMAAGTFLLIHRQHNKDLDDWNKENKKKFETYSELKTHLIEKKFDQYRSEKEKKIRAKLGGWYAKERQRESERINKERQRDIEIINDPFLEYSIQIFSSSDYYLVKEKFDFMTNQNNNYINNLPLKINDFFIVFFNSDLGNEYMLLYKNFSTRILASDYCLKYLNFLQKCLIVNAQNLN